MGKIFLTQAAVQKKLDAAIDSMKNIMERDGFSEEAITSWIDKIREHQKNHPNQNLEEQIWAYGNGFLPEYVERFHVTEENKRTFISEAEYDSLTPINGDYEKKIRSQQQIRKLLPEFEDCFPEILATIHMVDEKQVVTIGEQDGSLVDLIELLEQERHLVVRSSYYTQKEFRRELACEDGQFLVNGQEQTAEEIIGMLKERTNTLVVTPEVKWHSELEPYTSARSKIHFLVHRKTTAHAHVDSATLRVNPTKILSIAMDTGYCVYNPLEKIEFTVPNWLKIVAKIEKICSALSPQARLVQVSIIVTQNGFQISSLEGNLSFPEKEKFNPEILGMLFDRLVLQKAYVRYPDEKFRNILQVHYHEREQMDLRARRRYVEEYFCKNLGYVPDLDHPKTFNEKICWYKLFYENPLVTTCCDKYAVKQYVTDTIGAEYSVPVIGAWEKPEDVDYASLPNQFALKVNWASGFNIIVKDKTNFDQADAEEKLKTWMKPYNNSYYHSFNWGYKNVKPIAYAEKYIEQNIGQVYDYKFYCADGKVVFMFIATERYGEGLLSNDYYTPDFESIDLIWGGCARINDRLSKPEGFDQMKELAEKLAKPFPFVRVDFYEADHQIYVGEMTFYSGGGRKRLDPPEWEEKLGRLIPIPEKLLTEEK